MLAVKRDKWFVCPACHHKLGRAITSKERPESEKSEIEIKCQRCKEIVVIRI